MIDGFFYDGPLTLIVALVLGTLVGFVCGLVPGLGGRIGLVLSMPLAVMWEPVPAAIYLFALHSVIHTSSSIPAIAFGMPTSAADAATVLDGYPLAQKGRASEALGASLSASALGGMLGAVAFFLAIPVARTDRDKHGATRTSVAVNFWNYTGKHGLAKIPPGAALPWPASAPSFPWWATISGPGEPRLAFGLPATGRRLEPTRPCNRHVCDSREMLAVMKLVDEKALDAGALNLHAGRHQGHAGDAPL